MEIILIIVVVVVIFLVIGGIDNDRPVSDWSDEKLERMLPKLEYAASAQIQARNLDKHNEHKKKAQEVKDEIEKRKQAKIEEIGEKTFDPNNTEEFAQLAQIMAEKSMNLLRTTMQENNCSEDEAKVIVANEIETLTKENINAGMNEEEANEKAFNQLLGIKS